jgi:phospholipid/cholesterol/gamma-HCH transport system permease protein
MVMVYQTCLLTTKVVDGRNQVGAQWIKLLVTGVGPSLTAMMLATRVGAGIAAEVGSMKVTEQLDALRMSGVTPVRYLIVPRFLACVVMTVLLSMFGIAASWAAGGATGYYSFQINPRIFFDVSTVEPVHVLVGLIKAAAFGLRPIVDLAAAGIDLAEALPAADALDLARIPAGDGVEIGLSGVPRIEVRLPDLLDRGLCLDLVDLGLGNRIGADLRNLRL